MDDSFQSFPVYLYRSNMSNVNTENEIFLEVKSSSAAEPSPRVPWDVNGTVMPIR